MSNQTHAELEAAIQSLWRLAAYDTPNLASYRDQIAKLRRLQIDVAFASIHSRTESLRAACAVLEQAITIASGATPASALTAVRNALEVLKGVPALATAVTGSATRGAARGAARGARSARRSASTEGLRNLRIVCVHGVGDHRSGEWKHAWLDTMQAAVNRFDPSVVIEPIWCDYDDLVAEYGIDAGESLEALATLTFSGVVHGIGDLFRRRRGIGSIADSIRWTAGMVAQWAADEEFRQATRERLLSVIAQAAADGPVHAVLAHSLGSLVSYDTFRTEPRSLRDATLVTFGSQIGSAFVRSSFGGALRPVEPSSRWWHLYNKHDRVFTAPIRLSADNFTQIETAFDLPGDAMNHDARAYLGHANAAQRLWGALAATVDRNPESVTRAMTRSIGAGQTTKAQAVRSGRRSNRRALLIGINDYPKPEDRLNGCVNDVFTMSAALQEMQREDFHFTPDDIRVVLNDRATAKGIRERLEWLFDDVRAGDTRFLYFSGHGAQMATYNAHEEPDHLDECLVPWDFEWSEETAICDDDLYELYADLPYDPDAKSDKDKERANARVVIVLDCCHSGGLSRGGAAPIARGLAPPDDIRHRALKWDAARNMWVPRGFKGSSLHSVVVDRSGKQEVDRRLELLGTDGVTHRIGAAAPLRVQTLGAGRRTTKTETSGKASSASKRQAPSVRPFMPLILQSCQENQYAYEYRHGVESHGAFTWCLSSLLRHHRPKGGATIAQLVKTATIRLKELGYDQRPELRGPTDMKSAKIV
jgi:metacaspase-1